MAESSQRVVVAPNALDAFAPVTAVPPVVEDFPAICQICMDAPASVFQVCGVECLAEVCEACIVRHLTASVYSFYPGVLPKIRCPVCLNLLNRNQWDKFVLPIQELQQETQEPEQEQQEEQVEQAQDEQQQQQQDQPPLVDDNRHVLDKYVMLCRQSCGFQSPCCHRADYSMLPERFSESGDEDDDDTQLTLPLMQVEALDELRLRAVEFCYHREETSELYEFLVEKFENNAEEVLWGLLPKIFDEERRAALLLRHLNKHPNTTTRCCGMKVCFKCKATYHHDGDCRDFIEDQNVVECRGCGVTVVMVDGCDTLHCLCGFSFSWSEEVARQCAQRKMLAPTENVEYDRWERWSGGLKASLQKVKDLAATKRELRLARLVREHRSLLRRVLLRQVLLRRVVKKDPESVEEAMIKLKSIAESPLTPESPLLSRSESAP